MEKLIIKNTISQFAYQLALTAVFLIIFVIQVHAQNPWLERESENFRIIYKKDHSHIITHILNSAEKSLDRLSNILNIKASEKIIINTYDVHDYGFASATSVPQNFIRLEIEPFEPGYETILYNDRFQWLLSHELVHILINDQCSVVESINRTLFSKVSPDQKQPVSVLFSLLTNSNRFTPRWHQESLAIYLETWLSGGFGRTLGNFDEMYFRTLVLENREFPTPLELETFESHNSFLLQTVYYLLGGRFATYLAIKYGSDNLIKWFKTPANDFYSNIKTRFEDVFNIDFGDAWNEFILFEKHFQSSNLNKLRTQPLTPIVHLQSKSFGWVTQPYYNRKSNEIIFGYHKSHKLASIQKINLLTLKSVDIGTLPTPSMHQVASTAFDENLDLLFYSTNNNQLYRDISILELNSKETRLLFKDSRIGQMSISPVMHELWGIQHSGGGATLVFSKYPFKKVTPLIYFQIGDEIHHLSISPSGNYLAIIIHRSNGDQKLIIAKCEELKNNSSFNARTITNSGSPENPSWSLDEKQLFWNAYNNGVSNIYRYDLEKKLIEPLSHNLSGLFKPTYLNEDSIFVFEYTTDGFRPAIIPNEKAKKLPAIYYLGQNIIKDNPEVTNWGLNPAENKLSGEFQSKESLYSGLNHLSILSFIPVVSGFQKEIVYGFFTHISDPLINHDIKMEVGYSPITKIKGIPKFHIKVEYDYKKKFMFKLQHNAPDFYDLFNERKRGIIGTKITLGNKHFWIYDNPYKLEQNTEIAVYSGVEFILDNLVKVSEPDFMVAQTELKSKYLRRTIGSSDYESGNQFSITFRAFGSNPREPQYAAQIYSEWDHYSLVFWKHNVFHFKIAAGYHHDNKNLIQSRFYFGGFGNRYVENEKVKQYRKVFRFPGIPIYSLSTDRFVKIIFENNLPPIRFGSLGVGAHFINHLDFAFYTQGIYANSAPGNYWIDIGAQINLVLKHWFNLESTISGGIAQAWSKDNNSWEWFVSLKLLKN